MKSYNTNREERERVKRGENYYNQFLPEYENWLNGENNIEQLTEKTKILKESKASKPSRKIKHKLCLALGASGLILCSQSAIKNLSNSNDMDNNNVGSIIEILEDIHVSEKERAYASNALYAAKVCSDSKSTMKEKKEAEEQIFQYMVSGMGKKIGKNIVLAKINQAKLYGDYECIKYDSYDESLVTFVDRQARDNSRERGIEISGVSGDMYSIDCQLLSRKLPKDMAFLVEDILDYDECETRQEWIKAGKQLLEDEETIMCEFFALDERGNMNEITQKEYSRRKQQYIDDKRKIENESKRGMYKKYDFVAWYDGKAKSYDKER